MTEFYPNVMAETMIAQLTAEVERWRRHGVRITEDCGEPGCVDGTVTGVSYEAPCGVCDGSGKVLKDGLEPVMRRVLDHFGVYTPDLLTALSVAVASWLEGASDE